MDNKEELKAYRKSVKVPFKLGSGLLQKKNQLFLFIPHGLGIRAKDILEFYVDEIEGNEHGFN